MTRRGVPDRTPADGGRRVYAGEFGSPSDPASPSWLLRQRTTIPDPLPGFFDRPALMQRCTLSQGPATLMIAPAGFGKTTLLAQCCRAAVERGAPAAWLSLDRQDDLAALDTCLAFAFQQAGFHAQRAHDGEGAPPYPRIASYLRPIAAHGGPCVLALDRAEQLENEECVALLNFLILNAPPQLHFAIAGRALPPGLNVTDPVLGGQSVILTAGDLRFTRDDIAEFFDHKLSRSELATMVARSAGWPIALRIQRNEGGNHSGTEARVIRHVMENWMEAWFRDDFTEADRDFLLDLGLFEWLDAALLEEVLGDPGAMQRLDRMPELDGLLEQVRGSAPQRAWRLHPLLRTYCARRQEREAPVRYRSRQHGIAQALARRGHTVAAMRHATKAGDTELVTTILLDAGGLRLLLREGITRLVEADRCLPKDAVARHPRLTLVRCVAQAANGHLPDARRLLALVPRPPPACAHEDPQLNVDHCLARTMLAYYGCESPGTAETRALVTDILRVMSRTSADLLVRSTMEAALCVARNLCADFGTATLRGRRALQTVSGRSPVMTTVVQLELGQIAMARGHVEEAVSWYQKAAREARPEPALTLAANTLMRELELERNRIPVGETAQRMPRELRRGAEFAVYAAASDVAVELTLAARGVDEAIRILDETLDHARDTNLPTLTRHLIAQRVSLLADAGRPDEAALTWTAEGLPASDADCLDLRSQTWREVESVACARLRLLIARRDFGPGRRLARALLGVASEHRLRRTSLRAMVLRLKLDYLAGETDAAQSRLAAFLELFSETGYARPLVRERAVAVPLLTRFLEGKPETPLRAAASGLLATSDQGPAVPQLSRRALAVISRLDTETDKQIASALGLSPHGVRYHVRSIFEKLGTRSRLEASGRARDLGLLPQAE